MILNRVHVVNKDLLKDYIRKSGYKLSYIARSLGVTQATLSSKLSNRLYFRGAEVIAICVILNIPDEDKEKIFA